MSGTKSDGSPNECETILQYDYLIYYNTHCVKCFNNILKGKNFGFICDEKGFICNSHILNHLGLKKTTLTHSLASSGTYSHTYSCSRPFCNKKKNEIEIEPQYNFNKKEPELLKYFKTENDITKDKLEAYIKFFNLNFNCNEDNTPEQLFNKLQEIGIMQGYKIEKNLKYSLLDNK